MSPAAAVHRPPRPPASRLRPLEVGQPQTACMHAHSLRGPLSPFDSLDLPSAIGRSSLSPLALPFCFCTALFVSSPRREEASPLQTRNRGSARDPSLPSVMRAAALRYPTLQLRAHGCACLRCAVLCVLTFFPCLFCLSACFLPRLTEKSTDLLLRKLPFQRLVREIAQGQQHSNADTLTLLPPINSAGAAIVRLSCVDAHPLLCCSSASVFLLCRLQERPVSNNQRTARAAWRRLLPARWSASTTRVATSPATCHWCARSSTAPSSGLRLTWQRSCEPLLGCALCPTLCPGDSSRRPSSHCRRPLRHTSSDSSRVSRCLCNTAMQPLATPSRAVAASLSLITPLCLFSATDTNLCAIHAKRVTIMPKVCRHTHVDWHCLATAKARMTGRASFFFLSVCTWRDWRH